MTALRYVIPLLRICYPDAFIPQLLRICYPDALIPLLLGICYPDAMSIRIFNPVKKVITYFRIANADTRCCRITNPTELVCYPDALIPLLIGICYPDAMSIRICNPTIMSQPIYFF